MKVSEEEEASLHSHAIRPSSSSNSTQKRGKKSSENPVSSPSSQREILQAQIDFFKALLSLRIHISRSLNLIQKFPPPRLLNRLRRHEISLKKTISRDEDEEENEGRGNSSYDSLRKEAKKMFSLLLTQWHTLYGPLMLGVSSAKKKRTLKEGGEAAHTPPSLWENIDPSLNRLEDILEKVDYVKQRHQIQYHKNLKALDQPISSQLMKLKESRGGKLALPYYPGIQDQQAFGLALVPEGERRERYLNLEVFPNIYDDKEFYVKLIREVTKTQWISFNEDKAAISNEAETFKKSKASDKNLKKDRLKSSESIIIPKLTNFMVAEQQPSNTQESSKEARILSDKILKSLFM